MTKYHKFAPAVLAALLMCATAGPIGQAWAGTLDEAFAPRPVPGLTIASLEVPVQPSQKAGPAPVQESAAPATPATPGPEKSFWDQTREFFGF